MYEIYTVVCKHVCFTSICYMSTTKDKLTKTLIIFVDVYSNWETICFLFKKAAAITNEYLCRSCVTN